MNDTDILVIKVENGVAVEHPLTYNNFLLLFPECTHEEMPTNETLQKYGYENFIRTNPPNPGPLQHSAISTGYVKHENYWMDRWTFPPFTQEETEIAIAKEYQEVRSKRDHYLRLTDWTQLNDTPLSIEEKQLWAIYRQALRDLLFTDDPFNINWPIEPKPIKIPIPPNIKRLLNIP